MCYCSTTSPSLSPLSPANLPFPTLHFAAFHHTGASNVSFKNRSRRGGEGGFYLAATVATEPHHSFFLVVAIEAVIKTTAARGLDGGEV